ncbi:cysteine synthase family protein [Candidatus Poribacteria bacterium]|nr:cysteine synthase family protein [Candidatus Poribacteria bacterium]MYH84169.1 cysteine synthase family protein [Candidatus Poribacteria bacterium]MYK97167.1 cysteine synthase family protein [Candidatus Poribacteria bacterium]
MSMRKPAKVNISEHPLFQIIGQTPLAKIDIFADELPNVDIYAKIETYNPGGSIKDRPVLRMLTEAIASGELTHEKVILDSSSGNAAIAYAMIGAALGYKVELVIPDNASEERIKRIQSHGANIIYTDALLGYDEALREVDRRYEARPDRYFFNSQYDNENNWQAHYETTGVEIWEQTGGKVTHFVAGVGTGGTITGVGRRLKSCNPNIQVCSISPEVFPGIEGLKPLGDPENIVPAILDESVIDSRIPTTIENAYEMCSRLARRGWFVGQSSGGYLYGAYKVAQQIQEGVIVTVFNDLGERYFSTRLWD